MASAPAVLVIGDVMTDIVVKPDGPVITGADRRATIRVLPGGSGANQAAWLAAEGVRATFAGRVGAGDHASQAKLLVDCGVIPVLARDQTLPTGQIVTLLSPDGERSFFTDRGANENLCRADLADDLLDGVDLVQVSGYALFSLGPRAAVLEFLREAERRRLPFSVDAASSSFLEAAGAEEFLAWTRSAAICFANAAEAAALTGTSDPDGQLLRLARAYKLAVIKAGARGAAAVRADGQRWRVSAPSVEALDTSGAGDAFLAGFLAAYLRGDEIEACLRAGVDAGSLCVMVLGGRPAQAGPGN